MRATTKPQSRQVAPKHWLNRNILGMGLASLFSDWNHEMASMSDSADVSIPDES